MLEMVRLHHPLGPADRCTIVAMTALDATDAPPRPAAAAPLASTARIVAGVSLVLAGLTNGLSQFATHLVSGDLGGFSEQIRWGAEHPAIHQTEQFALVASMLFLPVGLLGLAQVTRWRAPKLTAVAIALVAWGMWGFHNVLAMGYTAGSVAPGILGVDAAVGLNDGLVEHAGTIVAALLPHLLGSFVGLILLSVAALAEPGLPAYPARPVGALPGVGLPARADRTAGAASAVVCRIGLARRAPGSDGSGNLARLRAHHRPSRCPDTEPVTVADTTGPGPASLAWARVAASTIAAGCAVAAIALSVAAVVVGSDSVAGSDAGTTPWKLLLLPVAWATPGLLVAVGRPGSPLGWLLIAVGGLFAASAFATEWVEAGERAGAVWAVWYADRASAIVVPLGLATLLLLPTGRLPGPRWRPVAAVVLTVQVALVTAWSSVRGPVGAPDTSFPAEVALRANPVGVLPAVLGRPVGRPRPVAAPDPAAARADRRDRPAVAPRRRPAGSPRGSAGGGGSVRLLAVVGRQLWPAAADALDVAGSVLLGAALASAALRRRLPGVDLVVHHAFVYTVLTVAVAAIYVARRRPARADRSVAAPVRCRCRDGHHRPGPAAVADPAAAPGRPGDARGCPQPRPRRAPPRRECR